MTTWTKRQQKAHRKAWVKALRSGEYEQARAALKVEGGFCCLGVACEISGLGKWKDTVSGPSFLNQTGVLPSKVQHWLGLANNEGGHETSRGQERYLSGLNDEGRSFKQIARIIEREPKGLLAE